MPNSPDNYSSLASQPIHHPQPFATRTTDPTTSTGFGREGRRGGIKAAANNNAQSDTRKSPNTVTRSPTFGVEVGSAGLEMSESRKTYSWDADIPWSNAGGVVVGPLV